MKKKAKVDVVKVKWENDRYAQSLDEKFCVECECKTLIGTTILTYLYRHGQSSTMQSISRTLERSSLEERK